MFEAVYGGARGGGKTDASLGEFVIHQDKWKAAAKGLFIRRKQSDLVNTLERAKAIYGASGAKWHEGKNTFVFPSGAVIRFRYLDRDEDADRYQGQDYSRVYIEQLKDLNASLRWRRDGATEGPEASDGSRPRHVR